MIRPVVAAGDVADVETATPIARAGLIDGCLVLTALRPNVGKHGGQRRYDQLVNENAVRHRLLVVVHDERRVHVYEIQILPARRVKVAIKGIFRGGVVVWPAHSGNVLRRVSVCQLAMIRCFSVKR